MVLLGGWPPTTLRGCAAWDTEAPVGRSLPGCVYEGGNKLGTSSASEDPMGTLSHGLSPKFLLGGSAGGAGTQGSSSPRANPDQTAGTRVCSWMQMAGRSFWGSPFLKPHTVLG